MRYVFSIPTAPKSKERPRFNFKTGKVYTPPKTKRHERDVGNCAKAAGVKPIDGAVSVEIIAYFEVKKSWPKYKRLAAIEQGWAPDTAKDADNIAKAVKDGLNGIAYADDKQVARLVVEKRWAWAGSTSVTVEALA